MAYVPTLPEFTAYGGALSPGEIVADKYLIDSIVGVGGMGIVYLARHLQLGGRLALKFLSAQCLDSPEGVERFRREAQAAARLDSEHVVRVFDVGTHTNGLPYMVMEYLEGRDLGRIIQDSGSLPIDVTASLLVQTCSALDEAHRHGIIHRDLKPSNLFCIRRSDGSSSIKVVDFGISKVSGDAAGLENGITITGHVVGSPSYMSPEQMKTPNRIDHRSDIWQLGVVLYECLTGKLPFPASTYAEICLKVHQETHLPVIAHGIEVPQGLQAIIDICLAKEPAQRFQTARDLAAALRNFAPHVPLPSMPFLSTADSAAPGAVSKGSGPAKASSKRGLGSGTEPAWAHSQPAPSARWRLPLGLTALALLAASTVTWLVFHHDAGSEPVAADAEVKASPPAAAAAPEAMVEKPAAPAAPAASSDVGVDSMPAPKPEASALSAPVRRGAPLGNPAPSVVAPAATPFKDSKLAPKTAPTRPPTERDPKSSVWTR
ncbi:MAG: serine/threonine protein kinase [Myxococcales bacterium]|nr:MAG: serine/threonine protein kinase [Myxococcales bacterium]